MAGNAAIGSPIGGYDVPMAAQICIAVLVFSVLVAAVVFVTAIIVHRRRSPTDTSGRDSSSRHPS